MAPYTVFVDAISKCFAATGLRLGWAVVPPHIQPKMKALIGHMGAWPSRPVQEATAWFLQQPDLLHGYMDEIRASVNARLDRLYTGIHAMRERGLPVDAIAAQGAIYLSFHVDLAAMGMTDNESARRWLLERAGRDRYLLAFVQGDGCGRLG